MSYSVHQFAKAQRDALNKRLDEIAKTMTEGQVTDWPHYKALSGEAKGIRVAIAKLDESLTRYDED